MRSIILLLFLLNFLNSIAQQSVIGVIPVSNIEVHRPSCGLNNGYIKIINNYSNLRYSWNTSDSKENTAFNLSEGAYKCVIKNNLGDSSVVTVDLERDPTPCDAQTLFKIKSSHFVFQNLTNGIVLFSHNSWGVHDKDRVYWSFGDNTPNSSQEATIHQYSTNGTYNVCLMTENRFGSDTLCKEIEINSIKSKGDKSVSYRSILNSDKDEWSNQIYFGAACNGKLFYGKNLSGGNLELWVKETEDSEAMKLNIGIALRGTPGVYTYDHKYICHNNRFYFLSEKAGSVYEYALYSTDGTDAGTIKHIDYDFDLRPYGFQIIENQIYMRTNSKTYKLIGNNQLEEVDWLSSPSSLKKFKDYYVSVANFGQIILFEKPSEYNYVNVERTYNPIGEVNGYFLFINETQNNEKKLWRTDGTQAGTQLVKDVKLSTSYPEIFRYQIHNNKLYFTADDNVHGKELWVSDGTTSGTYMLKDINTGIEESFISHFKSVGETLYFAAYNDVNGKELWKTDGTVSGTKMVKDITPDQDNSFALNPDYNFDKIISFKDSLLYFSVGTGNSLMMYDIVNDIVTHSVNSVCEGNIGAQNSLFWGADKLILLHQGLHTSCISEIPQVFDDIRYEGDNVTITDSLHRGIKLAKGLDNAGYSLCQKPLVEYFNYTQSSINDTHTFYTKDEKGCFSDKVSYTSYTYPGIERTNFSIGSAVKCGANQVLIRLNRALDSKFFSLNDLAALVSINDGPYVELSTTYDNNYDLKATLPTHNETDNFKIKVKSISRKVETESFRGLSKNTIEVLAPKSIEQGHSTNITVINRNGIYPYNLTVNNQTISNIRDEVFQFPISPTNTQTYTVLSTNSCGNVQVNASVNKVTVCESNISHMGVVSSKEYNSVNTITSSAKLNGHVTYNAGNSIILNPGFNVTGSVGFSANVKNCGQQ